MKTVGRNEPCPCGSGRKFKQCCYESEQSAEIERKRQVSAIRLALDWLYECFPAACARAVRWECYGAIDEHEFEAMEDLPADVWGMVDILGQEWLLAEGSIAIGEGSKPALVSVSELLLGSGGPLWTAEQRDFLQWMSRRAMSLYEVVSVRRGIGFTLRDLLHAGPEYEVRDRALSQGLERHQIFAGRLLPFGDRWLCTGGVCLYDIRARDVVIDEARDFVSSHKLTADSARFEDADGRSVGSILRDGWLMSVVAALGTPQVVDRHGDPILLVNDHYDVLDWTELARRLANAVDVEGDAKSGWSWLEGDDSDPEIRRTRLAINPERAKARVVCFAKTQRAADDGRQWFESLAGDAVRHVTRDVVDPRSPKAHELVRDREPVQDPLAKLTPAERTRAMQDIHEHIYRKWADEPIPALGNRTPREAAANHEGRERVARLLHDYEMLESKRARSEGREPIDFGFLWERVGLERAPQR